MGKPWENHGEMVILTSKNGDLTSKNCDLTSKNGDFLGFNQ